MNGRCASLLAAPFAALLAHILAGCSGESRRDWEATDAGGESAANIASAPASEFERALADIEAERPWAALWRVRMLLREEPDHEGALEVAGIMAYTQGRYDDACAPLERLATLRPLKHDELLALADACNRLNRYAAADSLFTLVLETDPSSLVHNSRGHARERLGRFADAATDFDRAIALDSRAPEPRLRAAALHLDRGRLDDATAMLAPFEDGTIEHASAADSGRAFVITARVFLRRNDPAGASASVESALALVPDDLDALQVLADVRRAQRDREGAREAARRHRESYLAIRQKELSLARLALVQGAIAIEAGQPDEAVVALEKGLQAVPDDFMLHCLLGPLYRALDRRDDARASTTQLRQAAGGGPPGPFFLETGKELRGRGFPAVAARQFELASKRMESGVDEARYLRALSLAESGDWAGALEAGAPLLEP